MQMVNQDRPLTYEATVEHYVIDKRFSKQILEFMKGKYDQSMLQQMVNCVHSRDIVQKHRGVIGIRKILSMTGQGFNQATKQFILKRILSKFIWLMSQNQYPQLRLQSCWSIANIATWETQYCVSMIEMGCLQVLRKLLSDNQPGIIDQAIFAISNIAADSVQHRDMILNNGTLQILINVVQKSQKFEIINVGTWAVSNLCKGRRPINKKYVSSGCSFLCKIIKKGYLKEQAQTLQDSLNAIMKMIEIDETAIDIVRRYEVMEEVFKLAHSQIISLSFPALRILGYFAAGDQVDTDNLIRLGIFDLALKVLESPKRIIRMQMSFILSNIAAGTERQIEILIVQNELLDKIFSLFQTDNIEIKKYFSWFYSNLAQKKCESKVIKVFQKYNVMSVFPEILQTGDEKLLIDFLNCLEIMLKFGRKNLIDNENILLQQFITKKGDYILENLQMHRNQEVYQKTIKILHQNFETGEPNFN